MIIDPQNVLLGGMNTRSRGQWISSASLLLALLLMASAALAQDGDTDTPSGEQDSESKALDSTATQWSFQFAYQSMPEYYSDTLDNGEVRPAGLDNYVQLRIVAPVPLKSMTLLPRLTIRHYENLNTKESGFGNTELFCLVIPKAWDWGTGRIGLGPLITAPGDPQVAKDEWGYGLAAAAVNTSGKWYYGLLFTQSWRSIDPATLPTGASDTNPLGVAPFLNYRLGKGWYIGNGDMVASYDWDKSEFYLPIGVRVGKVLVQEKGSWNFYGEYQTSLLKDNWSGPAVKDSYRLNVTYTMPLGM